MGYDKDYRVIPITFERGLVETVEDMMLPVGTCSELQNWTSDPSGNLRVRPGWKKASTTGVSGTRKGIGIGHYAQRGLIQYVQGASGAAAATVAPITVGGSFSSTTTAGNFLVACISMTAQESCYPKGDMSVTVPSGWTSLWESDGEPSSPSPNQGAAAAFCHQLIFVYPNAPAISTSQQWTIDTVASNQNVRANYIMYELSGVDNTNWGFLARAWEDDAVTGPQTHQDPMPSWMSDEFGVADTTNNRIQFGDYVGPSYSLSGGIQDGIWTLQVDDAIRLVGKTADTDIASPLAADTTYYVLDTDGTTWATLATAKGGSEIDITTTGAYGFFGKYQQWTLPRNEFVVGFISGYSNNGSASVSSMDTGWVTTHELYNNNGAYDIVTSGSYLSVPTNTDTVSMTWDFTYDTALTDVSYSMLFLNASAEENTSTPYIFVANNASSNTVIEYIDRDDLASGTWQTLETISVNPQTYPVAFATGDQKLFYTHQNWDYPRYWAGDNAEGATTPTEITQAPPGRCIAYHKDRLFVGGPIDAPETLYYSTVADPLDFTTGTSGAIDVGSGDGEPIEEIATVENGLLIGKRSSLYFLSGSGPSTFKLTKLPTNSGCAPGRTITPTAYGAMVAGRNGIQVFSGSSLVQISNNIRDTYTFSGDWMSGATVDDKYYILDQGSSGILALDLSEGTWSYEAVASSSTEGPAMLYARQGTLMFAPQNASVGSLLSYRDQPSSTEFQKDFNTLSETFTAWTPEIWPVGPEYKITPRYLFVKVFQRAGSSGDSALSITPVFDGRTQTALSISPATVGAGGSTTWHRFSIGEERGVSSFQLKFSQTAANATSAVWDICEVSVGVNVERVS